MGINVLSLFDGISCGRVALERAEIPVTNYYASEIDKYAIQVSEKNYPDIIRLGDVTKWREWDLPQIDLLIGGSPCQGFSFAGKQLNFEDPRSKLFFEFVDILNHYKPKYFFLENVRMKKEYQDVISEMLGVEPILINSALVSAQNRKRLYWTNIPNVTQPEDKGIMLKDVVLENQIVDREKSHSIISSVGRTTPREYFERNQGQMVYEEIERYKVPLDDTLQILEKETKAGKIGYLGKDSQGNRIYSIHQKSVTIVGEAGGRFAKTGGYLFGCITSDRKNKRQNGQRFNEGNKFYTLTAQDKHGVLVEGYVRKLTPVECERLQTLPDGYTEGVSNTQRYKALGNGWTVDVIVHIFRGLVK